MSSIPQNYCDENELIDCVQRFFSRHHVGKLLAKCNGMKEKGVSPVSLLRYKLSNIFVGRSMYMQQRTGSFKEDFSKNTFYRFLNSAKTNWLRFTSLLAADIVNNDLKDLTDDSRKNVFIVDDSLFSRTSCKKTELGSKVFDHTDMHFKKGFRMLTLSWSDGNTLIPVNSCLLASAKEANIIGPVKNFDNRTIAGKRRKLAQTKAPEAMITLLDTALSVGSSLAVLGEISIAGTLIKVDELANSLQVCLDSGAKKVLLPFTSAADLSSVPAELIGCFNLIFYSSAKDAVYKALGVE